ncbi:glycosyltransferase family 2 protein [Flavihumibacter sediminis]|nr:glycosyltransferase family 2 protein [Flavihumibacter sediminis]
MSKDILISVIIPVKNGDVWLHNTLSSIVSQNLFDVTEIIIIDSGSKDKTFEILRDFPIRLFNIPPSDFNHGTTRNFGVQQAKGKFVVMTVQDAKPYNNFWLNSLLEGFFDDKVAAVCGSQIVPHHADKNPLQWFRPISPVGIKEYYFADPKEFDALPPSEKLNICSWDDVNAMYRKDVLLSLPFRKVDFAEDALWAKDALLAGLKIVHKGDAQVEHYHFETTETLANRNFVERYHFYKYFEILPPKSSYSTILMDSLRVIKNILMLQGFSFKQKLFWLKYNMRVKLEIWKSNKMFHDAYKSGVEQLEELYNSFSKNLPQAVKPGQI